MLIILITAIIFVILSSILGLVTITAMRRTVNKIRYNKLDKYRELFRQKIDDILNTPDERLLKEFKFRPGSIKWKAIEDVLLKRLDEDRYRERIIEIFSILGYKSYYQELLDSRLNSRRLVAIERTGRLKIEEQTEKLIALLENKNQEISTASIIALSRMGNQEALEGILERLPQILKKGNISQRIILTSLSSFGDKFTDNFIRYAEKTEDKDSLLLILDTLSNISSEKAIETAIKNLRHEDPEVRVKALKILINSGKDVIIKNIRETIVKLLYDPHWAVRFHALKLIHSTKNTDFIKHIGQLLFDSKWQVRVQSAQTLASMGDSSLEIFLNALSHNDKFVRDAICEEIEKSGYVNKLIENLLYGNGEKRIKSKKIIKIMFESGFTTPFKESVHFHEIIDLIGESP